MIIYFAGIGGWEKLIIAEGVRSVLCTFADRKGSERTLATYPDVFVDSGAFSISKGNASHDVETYGAWCLARGLKPKTYATLDVVGDAVGTHENTQYMWELGLDPIPVFTRGAPIQYLKEYCARSDRIAIGGTATAGRGHREPFLDWAWDTIAEYWPIRVHGFGVTARWALEKYPWHSVDSTTWVNASRMGNVLTSEVKQMAVGKHADEEKLDREMRADRRFAVAADGGNEVRLTHNIRTMLKMQDDLTRLWTARGVTWDK